MTWLSEDPWPLAGACLVLAVGLLLMLKITQQGKYLAWAGAAAAAAGLVFGVEWLWVTDRERIERVVYDMADAVEDSDFERLEAHLAPEFDITDAAGDAPLDRLPPLKPAAGAFTKIMIRGALKGLRFQFVRISRLQVEAGRSTGMGTADFLAQAQWDESSPERGFDINATPPPGVGFSVGFREVEPDVWQVARIDVTSVPGASDSQEVASYLARFGR